MRRHRALVALLLPLTLAVTLTACDGTDGRGDLADVDDVAGVAGTERVAYADDPESSFLRVTLEDDLSEDEVRAAVDGIKDVFDQDGAADPGSLQVVFDGFRAGAYPRHSGIENPDPDLERALWLRSDGRATSFGPGPHFRPGEALSRSGTRPLAVAPTDDVVRLALDLEAEVSTENEVRRGYLVGSPDGSMRVQWSNYPSGLDRSTLETFAALQERLPGTTGWYDDTRPGAGVHFDEADLTLAQALARGPRLVAGLPVEEVGWGPFRAQSFAELRRITGDLGRVVPQLVALDGLRAVSPYGDIYVDDLATLDAVRRLLPGESVSLAREPSDLIGFEPDPVLTISSYTPRAELPALRGLAGIDGVRSVGPGYLALERGITDDELTRALTLVRPWVRRDQPIAVHVGEAPIYRLGEETPTVGTLTVAGAEPPDQLLPGASEDDVARVAAAWDALVP